MYDLAAMVALYRPGPMDNIPAYIRRKHGQEQVEYLHPLLEPYLDKTYGIFVYQEDIMAAAIALGGFTGPEADTLGYAIRKKKSSVLRAQKEKFVSQAAERGVAPKVIDAVFKAFEPFERYGFNKAHATCYGLIAYQTAYLKANYTVEYMTSVLTAFRDNAEKVAAAVAECRRLGIDVRTPDIHRSHLGFTVEDDAIRFGLLAVKNVGEGAIESIIKAREEGGEFRSLTDFCTRVDLRLANRKVLESLTRVGALNVLGHPAQILLGLDDALAAGQAAQRDRITGQTSLFDMGGEEASQLERPLPATPETPVRERLRWEKELMGLYLSDHPMGEVADRVGLFVTAYSGDLKDETLDGQRVVIGGIVTGNRTIITKSKSTMAVVTLEDLQGTLEVVVFPKTYEQTVGTWRDGAILLVAGRVDHRGDEASLLADSVWDWDEVADRGPEAFAREVGSLDKRGRRAPVGAGTGAVPAPGLRGPGSAPATAAARAGTGTATGASSVTRRHGAAEHGRRSRRGHAGRAGHVAAGVGCLARCPRLDRVADASVRGPGRRGGARDPGPAGGAGGPDRAGRADLQRHGAARSRDRLDRGRRRHARGAGTSRRGAGRGSRRRRGAVTAGRGLARGDPQRPLLARRRAGPGGLGDAGVQGRPPRATRRDPGRRPRAGARRLRPADGAPGRRLRRGARGGGPPPGGRRDHRPPARLTASFAAPESARRHRGVICARRKRRWPRDVAVGLRRFPGERCGLAERCLPRSASPASV